VHRKNGKIVVEGTVSTPPEEFFFLYFWISWGGGIIQFGCGNAVGVNIVITFNDTSPLPIDQCAAKSNAYNSSTTITIPPSSPPGNCIRRILFARD